MLTMVVFRFYSRNTLECVTQSIIEIFCLSRKGTHVFIGVKLVLFEKRFISNPIKRYRLHKQQLWEILLFILLFIFLCFPCCSLIRIQNHLSLLFLIRVHFNIIIWCSSQYSSKYSSLPHFSSWYFLKVHKRNNREVIVFKIKHCLFFGLVLLWFWLCKTK